MRALFALMLIAAAVAAACRGGGGSAPSPTAASTPVSDTIVIPAGQPITIGVSAALSGEEVLLGTDIADASELAVEEFGPIAGRAVRAVRKDDRCTDPEAAVNVGKQLIGDPALAGVIGPLCTTGAQAADRVYERARVVHIAVSATRQELSAQNEVFFFRTSWHDDAQARVQADYAYTTAGARTALVIDDTEPYGRNLADAFASAFETLGGRIVGRERITRGSTDFTGLARQAETAAAGVVVYEGLNPEGGLIVKALRQEGFAGTFIGPDSLLSLRDFLQTAGPQSEGAIITGGATPDEAFIARFNARWKRPPSTPFVLQAHDAVTALLSAMRTVATEGENGALTIDRNQLARTLRAQGFPGLTGPITFDERGDRRSGTPREAGLRIYRVVEGRFVPVD